MIKKLSGRVSEMQKIPSLLFIDSDKTFHNVEHKQLSDTLKHKTKGKDARAIRNLYKHQLSSKVGENVEIKTEVKRSALSPYFS